jgi:hypothetical protein
VSEILPVGSITVKDLYVELQGMRSDLVRAVTHMERIDARGEVAANELADHETRLRALERFRWSLMGAAASAGAIAGAVGGWAGYLLGHH